MAHWTKTLAALALPLACLTATATASTFPDKAVKIVVPYSTGGSSDVIARSIGDLLAAELGQPVVVENRAGAGSMIGTEYASKAPADGYTLLLADVPFTIVPALYKDQVSHNAAADFAPVALLGESPMYLFTRVDFPAKTVGELVDMARKEPGKITIGSGGNGSFTHMMAELLMEDTNTEMVHVPYKGAAASVRDLAGSQLDVSFSTMPSAAALYQGGKIVPIAVSSPQRSADTPNVPTLAESGFAAMTIQSWWGLMAKTGTPEPALTKLRAAANKVLQDPQLRERLARVGVVVPEDTSAKRLSSFLQEDFKRWEELVRAADIRIQ